MDLRSMVFGFGGPVVDAGSAVFDDDAAIELGGGAEQEGKGE